VRVYVGQTRGALLIKKLRTEGIGEMTVRGELPPRRTPWAFDNGAFRDWKAKQPFDAVAFRADLERIGEMENRPDFIVTPDIVAAGRQSARFSVSWLATVRKLAPAYLAVQDGMEFETTRPLFYCFDGVFLGGTLNWKIRTGAEWVRHAHLANRPIHVGRCGTAPRIRWAHSIGADSIDSSLPLWSSGNLRRFLRALDLADRQMEFDSAGSVQADDSDRPVGEEGERRVGGGAPRERLSDPRTDEGDPVTTTRRFEDCRAVRDSGKALLVEVEGEKLWVPHSVVHDDSEVFDAEDNAEGALVVQEWWAEKRGL
jgi:hypothetical protein